MKNLKILIENNITLNPFESFPFADDKKKCQEIVDHYKDLTPSQMTDILRKSKQARHNPLSVEEEVERDQITYALFNRMVLSSDKETLVDSEKLRNGDEATVKQLEWNKLHKPVTSGNHSFILSVLPSRHQRCFARMNILCGFPVNVRDLRRYGCGYEADAYEICQKVAA